MRYKKWFPVGIFSFLIPFYISYYPKKLDVKPQVISMQDILSTTIVFTNENAYKIKNLNINLKSSIDADFERGITLQGGPVSFGHFIKEINPSDSKHINTDKRSFIGIYEGAIYKKIRKLSIDVTYSFETPFYYPNIKNEVVSFKGYLKPNGELVYVYN
ncbi:hypothetical protein FUA26_02535 [Seonamhaeicola algicola]|uniref:Uncharacterized protein n=1 Tax=Seonamhaeicola algicola TaxID=1719036 RepID=A0A5C7AZ52_9FLAO|nr:hypothetical protein [Seonamhaeicola algicola]TXE13791.1 hypothetical protein FUA26_02535 [Seonamhaeicola algicola]